MWLWGMSPAIVLSSLTFRGPFLRERLPLRRGAGGSAGRSPPPQPSGCDRRQGPARAARVRWWWSPFDRPSGRLRSPRVPAVQGGACAIASATPKAPWIAGFRGDRPLRLGRSKGLHHFPGPGLRASFARDRRPPRAAVADRVVGAAEGDPAERTTAATVIVRERRRSGRARCRGSSDASSLGTASEVVVSSRPMASPIFA